MFGTRLLGGVGPTVLAALAIACGPSDTTRSADPARPPEAPAASDVTRQQPAKPPSVSAGPPSARSGFARQAMVSAYFYAEYEDADWIPEAFRPLPLEDAVRILRDATGPFAESRRRRAGAVLYAAEPSDRRRAAVAALFGPGIVETLDRQLGALDFDFGTFELVSSVIEAVDALLGPSIPGCDRTYVKKDVSSDSQGATVAKGWISVDRPLDALRPVLDPQNWDVCEGDYFVSAKVAKRDSDGSYPVDANFDALDPPLPVPPVPGSDWDPGTGAAAGCCVLFEHFVVDVGRLSLAQFRMLLEIDTDAPADYHHVDFYLRDPVQSRLGWIEKVGGGIDVDEGCARAVGNGGTAPAASGDSACDADLDCAGPYATCVEAAKVLRLNGWGATVVDKWMNFWTKFALQIMMDEAYETVCCTP